MFFASEWLTVKKVYPSMNIVCVSCIGNLLNTHVNGGNNTAANESDTKENELSNDKIGYFGSDNYLAKKFEYMRCTGKDPSAGSKDVTIEDIFSNLKKVYYIPSIRGESYPWKNYKTLVLKQLLKEMN